jgi:hypothetical protein
MTAPATLVDGVKVKENTANQGVNTSGLVCQSAPSARRADGQFG